MPSGVEVCVVTVNVDVILLLAGGVTDVGFKMHPAVGSTGETEQVRPTAELKLLTELTVMVDVVDPPKSTVPDAGLALKPKSATERVVA